MTSPNTEFRATADEEPPSPGGSIVVELMFDECLTATADVDAPLESADAEAGSELTASAELITQAIRVASQQRGFHTGSIGVRITDDRTIRLLNAKHLGHDYATDVISFGYAADPPVVEGELVASIDTARRQAAEIGWPAQHELLLYIVHGTLHITGMDDHHPIERAAMRRSEAAVFRELGIEQIERFGADQVDPDSINPSDGATQ